MFAAHFIMSRVGRRDFEASQFDCIHVLWGWKLDIVSVACGKAGRETEN
jgi:hypothetical protein